tara:strand:+ start:1264 stop:3219 length:1956 start_codon:yes stop_codon:yes gene_type:complete
MEERNRFQKALDIFRPSRRAEQKLQSNYNQLFGNDASIYGYNTSSGFIESNKLKEIGDGSGNSAVTACLNVLSTSFSEPPLQVVKRDQVFGDREIQYTHPLAELYHRPNPFMSQNLMSHYIVMALNTLGDAFLYKNRNKRGQVVELVPLMPHMVEVRGSEERLITHYEYYAYGKGDFVKIPFEDMVHIRQGIDPNDHRRGHAPLKTVLREILGDEAAGQFTFALLDNMAVPGVVLTPRNDGYGGPTREEAETISAMYKEKFGGANRGAPMVLSGAMNVEVVSFSPEQMRLAALRRIPEERVSAVLGVPAILAGLGAGLDSATYNNTKELKEFFTEQKLIPMWRTVAAELTHQLLIPDFGETGLMCDYDIQSVRALQPDVDNLYKRVNMGVSGGWITIGEARKVVGLEVDKTHDVYLRPLNMIQVDEDGIAILNDPPQQNRDASRREQEQLRAASLEVVPETKDTLNTTAAKPESRRTGKIKPKPTRLKNDNIEELKVSTEEAEVLHESQFEIEAENEKKSKFELSLARKAENQNNSIIEARKRAAADMADEIYSEKVKETHSIPSEIMDSILSKIKEHNSNNPKYTIDLKTLTTVFIRGVGAKSADHPESAYKWGMGRVNGFLHALRKDKFKRKPYDKDLLPINHPLSSKK